MFGEIGIISLVYFHLMVIGLFMKLNYSLFPIYILFFLKNPWKTVIS